MDGLFTAIAAGIIALHFGYLILCYIIATIKVSMYVFSTNIVYITLASTLPFVWWAVSTKRDEWNFYARKKLTLRVCILNALFTISQVIWMLVFKTAIIKMTTIATGRNFTVGALLNLCRIILVGSTIGVDIIIYLKLFEEYIFNVDSVAQSINNFSLNSIIDTRENKENLYDLDIVREIEHGKMIPIKEHDRFVHMFDLGSSGTGKTSTTLLPAIICDLNHKYENAKKRKGALFLMLKKKEACIVKPESVENPDESDITEWWVQGRKRVRLDENGREITPPIDKKSKEYKEYKRYSEMYIRQVAAIRKKYADCGITVMAPNNSLNDDVIRAASARGVTVNVIDPAKKYDKEEFPTVRQIGINPFYVPFNLSPSDRQKEIADKAETFANVLLAVSEIHGIGDQYFRDINEAVTTNVATVCMLNANLEHRQTNIPEVQKCINDFGCLTDMVKDIQTALHMKITVGEIIDKSKQKNNKNKKPEVKAVEKKREEESSSGEEPVMQKSGMFFDEDAVRAEGVPEKYRRQGYNEDQYVAMCYKEAENYYETLHFVLSELLGSGNEKMFDQARGLRNIINRILQNPDVKDILSPRSDFLDWDTALAENQITVINTALEFGPNASTALGILVMLLMKHAIVRRPKKMRSNHFLYIDEAAQYMHPMYEDFFALYRQYGVACTLAMQSLSQFEKSPVSKYLRGVFMEAGIHIVFGRLTPDEMKTYEAMSGMVAKEIVQTSENSNSEFDENFSITKGKRVSVQDEATITGNKTRMRQFREVTVYMIDEGNVKDGFVGKVSFSTKGDFKERPEVSFNFAQFADFDMTEISEEEEERRINEKSVEQYETDYHYRTKDVSPAGRDMEVPAVKGEGRFRHPDREDDPGKVIPMPRNDETIMRLRKNQQMRQMFDGTEFKSFKDPDDRAAYDRRSDEARKMQQEALREQAEEAEDDNSIKIDEGVDLAGLVHRTIAERNYRRENEENTQDEHNTYPAYDTQEEERPVINIPDGLDDINILSLASREDKDDSGKDSSAETEEDTPSDSQDDKANDTESEDSDDEGDIVLDEGEHSSSGGMFMGI